MTPPMRYSPPTFRLSLGELLPIRAHFRFTGTLLQGWDDPISSATVMICSAVTVLVFWGDLFEKA